jgi:hypothetical protein
VNISAKQKIVEKKKRETKSVKKLEALKDLLGGVFGLHSLGESESLFFLIWTENILTILSENFICKQAHGSKNKSLKIIMSLILTIKLF